MVPGVAAELRLRVAPAGRAMQDRLTRRGKALPRRADSVAAEAETRILARLAVEQQSRLKELLYAAGIP
ncbi:hypothetical protein [Mycobacterium ahvazicum]|nr:hypothetical protein [Mycobacterium ahvazicum]